MKVMQSRLFNVYCDVLYSVQSNYLTHLIRSFLSYVACIPLMPDSRI